MIKIFASLVLYSAIATVSHGQDSAGIIKETYKYAEKQGEELYLDRYYPARAETGARSLPCVVFMFGGGFFTGQRDGSYYIPYFEFLVENGYTVVSIDYRLGFKSYKDGPPQAMKKGKLKMAKAFLAAFEHAINIAVEDLFDATAFVIDHSAEWNIDTGMIIANGSSAGAISVLHGQYAICNGDPVTAVLPPGFNYAGAISFAGAIFVEARDVTFRNRPCPILMFHGSADSNVPYDKIKKLGRGFYGSGHIAKKLTQMNSPHEFYTVWGATHQIAATPMNDNREQIILFIDKLVSQRDQVMIDTGVTQIGVPKKNIQIPDQRLCQIEFLSRWRLMSKPLARPECDLCNR